MINCPKCGKPGQPSTIYPNTFWCETDTEYYGEYSDTGNRPSLIGGE